jgi:hypothetical protein
VLLAGEKEIHLRQQLISLIRTIVNQDNAFELLEKELANLSESDFYKVLSTCGVIPEEFAHSSSEEKLWAKACDILLAFAWTRLGIKSVVLRVRGNSADVLGEANQYTLVGDAKAFRLSRTAKNQKDFKITALDDWRRSNTYACLVAPLYQFPSQNSQIYAQAKARNVTMLSYEHLQFLLEYLPESKDLTSLWTVAGKLSPTQDARSYWEAIADTLVDLTNQSYQSLNLHLKAQAEAVSQLADEGIEYWQSVIKNYRNLTQKEAIERLIKAERLDKNIAQIKVTFEKAKGLYG